MAAFKGSYKYTIDHKGRVNIPAKFRRSTASTSHDLYVITRGLEGCLFVYPAEEWERVEEKLRNLSFTQKSHRLFARHLLSNACDAQLDRQGKYCFRIMSNGLIESSLLIESIPQIIVSRCIARIDPQCLRKMPYSLLEPPLLF